MRAWLTPDTDPGPTQGRCLFVPDALDWIAIVAGALNNLCDDTNFEQFGTSTPEETAARFRVMMDAWSFNEGTCRMVGEIVPFAASSNPDSLRWLPCDGASILRDDYPALFAVIGTAFGAVDSDHFNIPDLRGRVPVGNGTGSGLSTRGIGDVGGEEDHQLTVPELAAHTHTTGNSILIATAVPPPLDVLGPNPLPATSGSAGGDVPHNTMQPFTVIAYFIVAQ